MDPEIQVKKRKGKKKQRDMIGSNEQRKERAK
jgi:hypothetical protein